MVIAEMCVKLTRCNCIVVVDTDPDLICCVVRKEIHLQIVTGPMITKSEGDKYFILGL